MRVLSDQQFMEAYRSAGASVEQMARTTGLNRRSIQRRKAKLLLAGYRMAEAGSLSIPVTNLRAEYQIADGVVMVGSDAHYWPGIITTAHRAFVHLIPKLRPTMVIENGDFLDGASISRHPPRGWDVLPTFAQELDACKERMGEIEFACTCTDDSIVQLRTRGNHDARMDTYLAQHAPGMEGVHGMQLADHFPTWQAVGSILINGHTMIKHRYHNGIQALYNNVLKSGISIVTGHRHALDSRRFTDYRGTRYAVDTGTMADADGPQFQYGEDNPSDHRSGFAVLTFNNGELMPPELVEVIREGVVWFRGKAIEV